MIRGALVALLSREDDMEVVAELDRGDQVVETAMRVRPDVAVLDIDMPGADGVTVAAALHSQLPSCRILILTGLSQPGYLLRALQAHVLGFLVKDAPANALADGVRRVASGQRVIDPDLVAAALDVGMSPLTPRETEVLRVAARGGVTRGHRGRARPFSRDSSQLPVERHDQGRWQNLRRGGSHRSRRRLALRSPCTVEH